MIARIQKGSFWLFVIFTILATKAPSQGLMPWKWIAPAFANLPYSIDFSPDGSRAVAGSLDGTFRAFDLATGRPLWQVTDGSEVSPETTAVFTSDGAWVVCGGGLDMLVTVRNASTGKVIRTSAGHTDFITQVAASPSSIYASADRKGDIKIWDQATGNLLRQIVGRQYVWSMRFSRDGSRLAAACDKTVRIYDTSNWTQITSFQGNHSDSITGVDFTPNGQSLVGTGSTGGAGAFVYVWDIQGINLPREMNIGERDLHDVVVLPGGTSFAAGATDNSGVFDLSTGQRLATFQDGFLGLSIAVTRDGSRIGLCAARANAEVCDPFDGHRIQLLITQAGDINNVSFTPDSSTLSMPSMGDLKIVARSAVDGSELYHFERNQPAQPFFGSYSPDGKQFIAADGGRLVHWNLPSQTVTWTTSSNFGPGSFSPAGDRFVVLSSSVRLLDSSNGNLIGSYPGTGSWCWPKYSPAGTFVASGNSAGQVRIWNADSLTTYLTVAAHATTVNVVCFSPDGAWIASGSNDGFVRIWNATTGQLVFESNRRVPVGSLDFSPDGKYLAIVDDDYRGDHLVFFSTEDWSVKKILDQQVGQIRHIQFAPDGRTIGIAGTLSGCVFNPMIPRPIFGTGPG